MSRKDVRTVRRCSKYERRHRTNEPTKLMTAEGIAALVLKVDRLTHKIRRARSKAARNAHVNWFALLGLRATSNLEGQPVGEKTY